MNILRYFSRGELRALQPTISEEDESERNRVAGEFLSWLGTITPDKISTDIYLVLSEHESGGEHMRSTSPDAKGGDVVWS